MNIRLGDPDLSLPPKLTPLGITYYSYGIDDYGPKRIRKAVKKMRAAGVAEYIIAEFEPFGLALPSQLANWLDAAYTARMDDWKSCAGHQLPNGHTITVDKLRTLTPNKLRIIFHAEPIITSVGEAAGATWSDRVEIMMAYLSNNNSWLRRADQLANYEIGNWFALQFDYHPLNAAGEIGNKKPCH